MALIDVLILMLFALSAQLWTITGKQFSINLLDSN